MDEIRITLKSLYVLHLISELGKAHILHTYEDYGKCGRITIPYVGGLMPLLTKFFDGLELQIALDNTL
jgi:hypothetical protein